MLKPNISHAFIGIVVLSLAGLAPVFSKEAPGVSLASPDHPSTWSVGAHLQHEEWIWDAHQQKLILRVEYSTRDYASRDNPTETQEYDLTFPKVQFDPASKSFWVRGKNGNVCRIAKMEDDVLFSDIVLLRSEQTEVRNCHGKIYASIEPNLS